MPTPDDHSRAAPTTAASAPATTTAAATGTVRDRARAARRELDPTRRAEAQDSICRRLLSLRELPRTGRVGWYLATDGEVDLSAAVQTLRSQGCELLLPIVGADRAMTFAPWGRDTELRPNRFGIPEPDHLPAEEVAAGALDAVVVPCVAVDPAGHRVGFGAGYYDRALAGAHDTTRIGVAFEVQVVGRLDPEPWDVPLGLVVTEARVMGPDANDPG